jgi:alpha-N-arabinofuranosidase
MSQNRLNARIMGAVALLALASGVPVCAEEPATAVTIEADKPGAKIERDLFGQFAEHLGTGIYGGVWVGKDSAIPNVRGIRSDVVAALKAIKVPVVRWPGGCFADEYHWRNGIGPANKRPATLNGNWGGVIEPNSFGSHEFFDFIDQIGAEAYLSVNVGSGSPQEAADWLEYLTADSPTTLAKLRAANGHPAPYKIKYLGLGNENWGCGGSMSPDHYVEEMKLFSHYARNLNPAQAGTMQRVAVGWGDKDSDYTEAMMKAWPGDHWAWGVEGLSIHSYTIGGKWPPHQPGSGFGEEEYHTLLKETLGMDDLITQESAIMDRYDPAKKVGLMVDEWGAWLAPAPGSNPHFLVQESSLRDGILAALNLNIFMRHADRVRMSNIAQMANVLQAMVMTDGPKMFLTPSYYVYKLYVPFQEATLVPVSFDAGHYRDMPRFDVVAARDAKGTLWLAVTNIDPNQPGHLSLDLKGAAAHTATGQILTGAKVDAVNSFAAPDAVSPKPIEATVKDGKLDLVLPAKSVAVLSVH